MSQRGDVREAKRLFFKRYGNKSAERGEPLCIYSSFYLCLDAVLQVSKWLLINKIEHHEDL